MEKKRIKILTYGILPTKGFINGPILTPFYESVDKIYNMILGGVHIVEVLEDGTEVKLNSKNFSKDNSKKSPAKEEKVEETVVEPTEEVVEPEAPVVEEEKVEETVVEPVSEPIIEDTVVETVEEPEIKKDEFKHDEVPYHHNNKKKKYSR